jgi:hypothetical protein
LESLKGRENPDDFDMDVRKIGCGSVNWIYQAQDGD